MLQILIPIYIMSGYVISESTKLFIKASLIKYICLVVFLFTLFLQSIFNISLMKKYSWINLKQDFGSLSEDDCIISLDIRTSKFSLEFLFPRKNWIFLNKNEDLNHLTRQCKGTLYYFNPVPYGLEEETDKLVFTEWEGMLKKQYCFKKINDITLYELKERKEK